MQFTQALLDTERFYICLLFAPRLQRGPFTAMAVLFVILNNIVIVFTCILIFVFCMEYLLLNKRLLHSLTRAVSYDS